MTWDAAGQKLESIAEHYQRARQFLAQGEGQHLDIDGKPYLIRCGYYIPYFSPFEEDDDTIVRERLNLELCNRIIRESEIRHVARKKEDADAELSRCMREFEQEQFSKGRGKAVVLFQNIVNHIRELSKDYLDCVAHSRLLDVPSLEENDIQGQIKELYEYIMVRQQAIMDVVRRADGSQDVDGTIRELFSEIGKPYRIPLSLIFESRVNKIGKAMAGMDTVADRLIQSARTVTSLPESDITSCVNAYVRSAKKLCGLPSFDHEVFNITYEECINALDDASNALRAYDFRGMHGAKRLEFLAYMFRGLDLIDDMKKLRDERKFSIQAFIVESEKWLEPSHSAA